MTGEITDSKVLWSENESRHEAGIGFLLSDQARKALLGYRPINECLLAARFNAQPFNITITQVHAPTADNTEATENFYEDLTTSVEEIPKNDILIFMMGQSPGKILTWR